jgi:6-phosphogluconolactonase
MISCTKVKLTIACAILASSTLVLVGAPTPRPADSGLLVYVGGYTTPDNPGILAGRFDAQSGRLDKLILAAEIRNPSFLAVHPDGLHLYAVAEINDLDGKPGGGVSAFRIDPTSGALTPLGAQSTRGAGPCHLVADPSGRAVLVANYGGGSVAAFPIRTDGGLDPASSFHQHRGSSVNRSRQEAPHAHGIYTDSQQRFALVPDLGLDQVLVYRFNPATAELQPNDPPFAKVPGGAGPRHLAFDPQQRHLYVINELSSTVSAFAWDADRGTLTSIQDISTLPKDFEGQSTTAEIQVHPNGRFLYASNRGHDSIAIFERNASTGQLQALGHHSAGGRTPRFFTLDPTGRWLLAANQNSDSIVAHRVNPDTGLLADPQPPVSAVRPTCIVFRPAP